MEQTGRNKTKYNSPHSSGTWSTKPTADSRVSPDAYWKYQRSQQSAADKNTRRHQTPIAEPTANYYSSANSYKNMKHHSHQCSTYPKHSSALHTEAPHRHQQTNAKSSKNKDYANSNATVMKKDRYKSQQEDETNAGYIDEESGNYTEDNLEDDAEEEAGNNQEVVEALDKEYDEQEVDDEADEESDALAESQAMQRDAAKREALLRAQQRLRTINQQQDPQRIHYRQYSPRLQHAHALATRYYNIPDHDIHEALSEEDLYVTQALKSPPRRSSAGYHQNWIPQQRSSADRYDTTTSPTQLSRRARPESKSFMEVEFADRRKCSRCGSISIRKPPGSRRNNYRFQDISGLPTKGRFVDDAELLDQFWCGQCKPRHYIEESMGPSEIPPSALYSVKSRRSRDTGTPMHETLEGKCATDELSHRYTQIPHGYAKDAANVLRDRIRQQSAQGPIRTSVRYDIP